MNSIVGFLLGQTVLIPLVIGIVRFARIDTSFYPFLLLLLMAFTSEVISFICGAVFLTTPEVTINIYGLIECIILLFQFHIWGFLKKKPFWLYMLMAAFVLGWLVENVVFQRIGDYTLLFNLAYCFLIVLLSINQINYMIMQDNQPLLKNARFILCLAFIIFFLYEIIYDAAYFIGEENNIVAYRIVNMFNYMNAFVNLIYAVAVLFMPEKKNHLYFDRYFE